MNLSRLLLFLIAIALAGFAFYLWRSPRPVPTPTLEFQRLTPGNWTILGDPNYYQCDFDADPAGDLESLILYRYDTTSLRPNGFIGGVIFTTEANRVPQAPGVQSPYRPAFLVPYKLLPDPYSDKGQGYLGENSVTVRFFPAPVQNQPCRAQEITVYGFGTDAANPTRLSIFRWDAPNRRYAGVHFAGDARIDVGAEGTATPQVTQATTYERFDDRSGLCKARQFTRQGSTSQAPAIPTFDENVNAYTINFCFGAPQDAAYPEGVVVALLRGANPAAGDPPVGGSYLLPGTPLPDELSFLQNSERKSVRVITVSSPSAVSSSYPAQGTATPAPPNATPGQDTWWLSAELAEVETALVLDDQPAPAAGQMPAPAAGPAQRSYRWRLRNIANERVPMDTRWRVESVERIASP